MLKIEFLSQFNSNGIEKYIYGFIIIFIYLGINSYSDHSQLVIEHLINWTFNNIMD